jgi:uncharacterized protein
MTTFLVKNSTKEGHGLFATENYAPGHNLGRIDGVPLHKEEITNFNEADDLLQIGTDLYLDMAGTQYNFINHSCVPNCKVQVHINAAFLVSILPIKRGEELTFDYSSTSTEDEATWKMECKCHPFSCRKVITGAKSIPEKQMNWYRKCSAIPYYLLSK